MQTAVRFAPETPVLVAPSTEDHINRSIEELDNLNRYQEWWNNQYGYQFIEYDPAREELSFELEGWRGVVWDYIPGIGGYLRADKHTWETEVDNHFFRDDEGEPESFAWKVLEFLQSDAPFTHEISTPKRVWE